ncbi:hypothetical protein IH992_01665 [Candidatus Poribacteria bacterium]|nr:hypothetical protein [Candidatus Poribacteria bacterium]
MEAILKEILTKLEGLENDVAEIKTQIQELNEKGGESEQFSILEQALRDKPLIQEGFRKFVKKWGIEGMKPIGAKKLREQILADGIIKPEDNEFSRGIIAMREE